MRRRPSNLRSRPQAKRPRGLYRAMLQPLEDRLPVSGSLDLLLWGVMPLGLEQGSLLSAMAIADTMPAGNPVLDGDGFAPDLTRSTAALAGDLGFTSPDDRVPTPAELARIDELYAGYAAGTAVPGAPPLSDNWPGLLDAPAARTSALLQTPATVRVAQAPANNGQGAALLLSGHPAGDGFSTTSAAGFAGSGATLSLMVGLEQAQEPATGIPVIVVFRSEADLVSFAGRSHPDVRALAAPEAWGYLNPGVVGAVQDLEARLGFRAEHVYSAALRGFAAHLNTGQIQALQNHPLVAYIERDGTVAVTAQTLPWGIDRIDADISSTLAGNGLGTVTNVNAYIIDTGIDTAHADLNVVRHVNFASGPNRDCNGHGTHVAGTVAARDNTIDVVGATPGAPLTGVKVLGCGGSGTISGVIQGVDWVTANAIRPAVANLSLGGGASQSLDDAVKRSADSGVFYSIAAGNSGADACNESPARAGTHNGVVTTAATNSSDQEPSWSNYGSCVDLWAPGVSILSTRKGGGTTTFSGTSMAAPHVGGTGALYLSSNTGASPATVEAQLKTDAVSTGTLSKDGRTIQIVYAGKY